MNKKKVEKKTDVLKKEDMLHWKQMVTDVFAGITEKNNNRIIKVNRLSVAIGKDGGAHFSHRIWVKWKNLEFDEEESPYKHTHFSFQYHIRNGEDISNLIKQIGEAVLYLKENSDVLKDYDADVKIDDDNEIIIRLKKNEEMLLLDDEDDDDILDFEET